MNITSKYEEDKKRRRNVVKEILRLPSSKRSSKNTKTKSSLTEGEECKEVERTCGVQLDMTTSSDGTMTIVIKGSSEKVKEARRELVMRLGNLEKMEVEVPRNFAGYVIGVGGKNIKKIEESTNCKIGVKNDQSGITIFTIRGEPINMKDARNSIHAIVSEHRDRVTKHVDVPDSLTNLVFGANNEKIEAWRTDYGLHIKAEKEGYSITGRSDRVGSVCGEISEICRQWMERSHSMQLKVERRRFQQLCSERQSVNTVLAEIMDKNNVVVNFGDGFFTFMGKVENMGPALTLLLTKINAHVFEDVEIPNWMYKHLRNNLSIRHSFHNGILTMDGPPEVVEEALEALQESISEISKRLVHVTLGISHKHHSRLIGRKGANVNDICDRFDVKVNFPGTNLDEVYLEGSPAGVEMAKEYILKFVGDIENETSVVIGVPSYQHVHIREDSTTIEILKSMNVHISYGDFDSVVLRGNSSCVSKCSGVISQLANQLSLVYTREVFECTSQLIDELKANREISHICDSNQVNIKLEGSNVVITGMRDGVKHAIIDLKKFRDYSDSTEELRIDPAVWDTLVINEVIEDICQRLGVNILFSGEICSIRGLSGVRQCKDELAALVNKPEYTLVRLKSPLLGSTHYKEKIDKLGKELGVYVCLTDMAVVGKNARTAAEKLERIVPQVTTCTMIDVREKVCNHVFNLRPIIKDRIESQSRVLLVSKSKTTVEVISAQDEDLKRARELLDGVAENLNSPSELTLLLEKHQIGGFIGIGGSHVRNIEDKFAVQIELFDKNENPRLLIRGSAEDCAECISEIQNGLLVVETVDVDSSFHSRLIGSGGARVAELREKYGVSVKFSADSVIVTGSQTNVDSAVEDLKDRVNQLQKEIAFREVNSFVKKLTVKTSHVGRIIGKKGTNISHIRKKFSVTISLEDGNGDLTDLTIVGSEDNVEKAVNHLSKIEEAMDAEVSMTITVPPSVRPILIGKKGRRMKEIMSKYNVIISFSKTVDSLVEIVGSADNANECAEHIEAIVDENVIVNTYLD